MAYTDQQIIQWFKDNPNATDAQIAQVAAQAGVSAEQLARVTGKPLQEIVKRASATPSASNLSVYSPASSFDLNSGLQKYLQNNPDVMAAYNNGALKGSVFGGERTPEEAALMHYRLWGANEGRASPWAELTGIEKGVADWVYGHEPEQYQKLYTALQSGKAKVVNDPEMGAVVVDASGNALQGVSVNPNTGQIRVPTSNGNLYVNTQIGPGGALAPIAPENYNKQVSYQSNGNDWDQYGGLVLTAAGLLGAPYLSGLIGGATGLTGAALTGATGATIGGLGAAVMGDDPLKGALLGGLGGYAMGSLSNAATPTDLGMNSQLTPAAIESGLGTPGYGYNAAAASSGLFNPAAVGAGAYLQTSYPYDMADFLAADALQLQGQVGNNLPAIEQNLVASGVDPLVAADVANQVALNPGISQYDLTNYINTTFGGGNIYDVNMATQYPTSQLPGEGGLLTNLPGAGTATGGTTTTGGGASSGTGLSNSQIANLIRGGLSLAGAGAIASNMGGGMGGAGALPTQGVPTNAPEYYQAIQQYYNTYMPEVPRDVATPLQQWYDSKYGA